MAWCDANAVIITRIGNKPRPEFKHAYGIAKVPEPMIVFVKLNVAVVSLDGTITNELERFLNFLLACIILRSSSDPWCFKATEAPGFDNLLLCKHSSTLVLLIFGLSVK